MSTAAPKQSALDGWIDICRTGTWTDSSGKRVSIETAHLDRMVQSYGSADPAPVVVGHPEIDAPAYAWVDSVRRTGDRLQMKMRDIMPAFREAVEGGRYSSRSIAVKEGALKHVGFLGGRAPAVPGLAPTQFSDTPDQVIEIPDTALASDYNHLKWLLKSVARMARGMREYIIEKDDKETADRTISAWEIESIQEAADELADRLPEGQDSALMGGPDNPNPDNDEVIMSDEDKAAQQQLADQKADIERREAALAEGEKKQKRQAALLAADAALGAHVDAGRVLPAERAGLAALMASLPDGEGETVLTFAEPASTDGGQPTDVQKKPRDVFEAFLAALPQRVNYGEVAGQPGPQTDPAPTGSFAMPAEVKGGAILDQGRLDLHNLAVKLAAERKIDYLAAVMELEQQAGGES